VAEAAEFFRQCAFSVALLFSLCGLIAIPFLTWLAIRRLAPGILSMSEDAAWQAPLAAIAAATPGATFLVLAIVGLLGASSAGCLNYVWGRILFGAVLLLLLLSLLRAVRRISGHAAEVRRLIERSHDANPSVDAVAARCRVRVRVLDYSGPFCALVGFWRPMVLISTSTLARLKDPELEAALRHERAHAVRCDLALAAALGFFAKLLPLPVTDLVEAYASAREMAADKRAVQECAPEALAHAILAAGTQGPTMTAAALAGDMRLVRRRIITLLRENDRPVNPYGRRIATTALLAAVLLASTMPALLGILNCHACIMSGIHV